MKSFHSARLVEGLVFLRLGVHAEGERSGCRGGGGGNERGGASQLEPSSLGTAAEDATAEGGHLLTPAGTRTHCLYLTFDLTVLP